MTSNRLETDEKAERSKPGRPFDETPVIFENRDSRGQTYPTRLKLHQHPSISRGKKARGNSNLTLGGGENFHPPRCSGGRLIDDVAASRVSRGRLIVGIGDSGA